MEPWGISTEMYLIIGVIGYKKYIYLITKSNFNIITIEVCSVAILFTPIGYMGREIKFSSKFLLKGALNIVLLSFIDPSAISINFSHLIDRSGREQSNYDTGT